MKAHELVASVQAHYGRLGWTVYDRRDRWAEEHLGSQYKQHEHDFALEGYVVVRICRPTKSVLITSEPTGITRCSRCLQLIEDEQLLDYLKNEMLCGHCEQVADEEHYQKVVEGERERRRVQGSGLQGSGQGTTQE